MPPNPPLDLDPTLNAVAQDLLGINTLSVQRSDSLDFHDVGVGSLRLALEAALRLGYAAAQAGRVLPPHLPSYDDAPGQGIDRLTPLFERVGLDVTGQVEPGYPQTREELLARRQAAHPRRRNTR